MSFFLPMSQTAGLQQDPPCGRSTHQRHHRDQRHYHWREALQNLLYFPRYVRPCIHIWIYWSTDFNVLLYDGVTVNVCVCFYWICYVSDCFQLGMCVSTVSASTTVPQRTLYVVGLMLWRCLSLPCYLTSASLPAGLGGPHGDVPTAAQNGHSGCPFLINQRLIFASSGFANSLLVRITFIVNKAPSKFICTPSALFKLVKFSSNPATQGTA